MSRFKKVDTNARSRNQGTAVAASNPNFRNQLAIAPPPLDEGQLRCPGCRNAVRRTTTGRLYSHADLFGNPCLHRTPEGAEVHLGELPPVVLPPVPFATAARASRKQRGLTEPSRLDAGSSCRECGKWLPGERSLCGRCSIKAAS